MFHSSALRPIINFHGIGEATRPYEPGEEYYWISQKFFEEILSFLSNEEFKSLPMITFDDANTSDLDIAAPRLQAAGLNAEFFILSGKLGKKGYLSVHDLHSLISSGMTIGSHGQNHVDWTRQSPAALQVEIFDAKNSLEDIIGETIDAAGIPFGKYNRKVLSALKAARFKRVYSSDGGWSSSSSWLQPRTSVRKDMNLTDIKRLLLSDFRLGRRMKRNVRILSKKLL